MFLGVAGPPFLEATTLMGVGISADNRAEVSECCTVVSEVSQGAKKAEDFRFRGFLEI